MVFFTQVFLVVAFDVLSLDLLEDDCGLPSLMQLQSETKYEFFFNGNFIFRKTEMDAALRL